MPVKFRRRAGDDRRKTGSDQGSGGTEERSQERRSNGGSCGYTEPDNPAVLLTRRHVLMITILTMISCLDGLE